MRVNPIVLILPIDLINNHELKERISNSLVDFIINDIIFWRTKKIFSQQFINLIVYELEGRMEVSRETEGKRKIE